MKPEYLIDTKVVIRLVAKSLWGSALATAHRFLFHNVDLTEAL